MTTSVPQGRISPAWRLTALAPFGLCVDGRSDADLGDIPPATLAQWIGTGHVVVLRGFHPLDAPALVERCERWGRILTWNFGAVLDLVVHEAPQNYLFTNGAVPFHWDGAFARATPRYIVFQCVQAPAAGSGGETLFCNSASVWSDAPSDLRSMWESVRITYRTEKVEHYGGEIGAPLVSAHPISGAPRLRYAEPLSPEEFLNPLFLQIDGLPEGLERSFVDDIGPRLYQPDVCYAHAWRNGDFVVVDNHGVLHGRNPFTTGSSRRLQRVHVL